MRILEIGEAVRRLPADLFDVRPEIARPEIARMREVAVTTLLEVTPDVD